MLIHAQLNPELESSKQALTSSASSVMNPVIEKPSMMSSSAEVDSFRFLRGGRGRDDEGSRSPSRSESEEKRKTEPLTWLFLIPFDLRSRSLSDLDFLFLRRPLDRGPSMSFRENTQINPPLIENKAPQGPNQWLCWTSTWVRPPKGNFRNIQVIVDISVLDPREPCNIQQIKPGAKNVKNCLKSVNQARFRAKIPKGSPSNPVTEM